MLDIKNFKLVALSDLVHHEALLQQYWALVMAAHNTYQLEDQFVKGDIDLGDDYVFEEDVMKCDTPLLRTHCHSNSLEQFLQDCQRKDDYQRVNDPDYLCLRSVLVPQDGSAVLGRAELWSSIERSSGVRTAAGFDYIHPDFRGQGLGHVIFAHRLNQARECGVQEIRIFIKDNNIPSMRRFQKFEARGCVYDHKFVRNKTIGWIKPVYNLEQAYGILTVPTQIPEPSMEPAF
jgi:predicted acetyltransferase